MEKWKSSSGAMKGSLSMASSSTSSHSTPASSSLSWNHDVFLSFRGEDTRKTFVDHLYTSLVEHGIHTYKDDKSLPRGEVIGPALLKAIRESRIAIIVFSENYADSSWCLDELAYIMKCKDETGQIVLPVFYHVDPSDIRKQKGKYKEAFDKHESENKNRVESWRKALFDAGNLSGWVPSDTANGHEAEAVKEIVNSVSNNLLSQISEDVDEDFIGSRIRLQELRSKLEVELGGVRMIGIWGIGGGGKTTLASSSYYEISRKFDGCSFVENIREKSSKYGIEILQEKILSDILKQKDMKVGRVEEGRRMIKSRLCHRNVLIVLDDIDHVDQLNMLAGSHSWFGEGSRIIITTRDIHLLKAHKINATYNIVLLNDDEAIKLFRKHAPRQDYIPTEFYETLSKDVVSYAGGLPLALKVLGSLLCDKDVNEWKSALRRLEVIPEDDIIGKLKISYNGLKPVEKELLLDIACFHRGGNVKKAMVSLEACDLFPGIGIKVLIQKALIIVSNRVIHSNRVPEYLPYSKRVFEMHDLIQEMGHYIVQGEHPKDPEKHSRIWREKDIRSIYSMSPTTNTDKIEAVDLGTTSRDCQHLPDIFETMKNIRLIYWSANCPPLLPKNFQPTKLCCLILTGSLQIQPWEGCKNLPNLKVLDLSYSNKLIKTPDLTGVPCLERMMIRHCRSLKEIHPSTGCHESLAFLNLSACWSLRIFPPITKMPKLVTLILDGCLSEFPDIKTKMDSLEDICLRDSGIKVLPSSIGQYCTNLVSLDLTDCRRLGSIEVDFRRFKKMEELKLPAFVNLVTPPPTINSEFSRFPHLPLFLTRLSLRSCNLLHEDSPSHIYELSSLQVLDLRENSFSRIPFNLVQFPRLKFLKISECKNLVELPYLPTSISVLDAHGCDSLKITVDFPTTYKWLWKVTLGYKVCGGENVLRSMFQGSAIADHFMSFKRHETGFTKGNDFDFSAFSFDFSRALGFEISNRSFAYETFTLQLPSNWYSDYSGFLICVDDHFKLRDVMIIIKQETHTDDQFSRPDVHDRTGQTRSMCYVPFSSLMHRPLWNGTISFSITLELTFKVELVPRRSEGGLRERSTNSSEFWDDEDNKTLTIEHASGTSIEVTWLHNRFT